MHWDSRVDKFNQRLQLIRKQCKQKPSELVQWERELRDVSLYEFCWKYSVYRGVIKRSARSVAIMVTPSFSADCANVDHKNHENYARAAVVAYWRLMSTEERTRMVRAETETGRRRAIDECFIGGTRFEHPPRRVLDPAADRFLGTSDLFMKFEGGRRSRWGAALMEMLVGPLLSTWVPDWVMEQYERAKPFFRDVLRGMRQRQLRNSRIVCWEVLWLCRARPPTTTRGCCAQCPTWARSRATAGWKSWSTRTVDRSCPPSNGPTRARRTEGRDWREGELGGY